MKLALKTEITINAKPQKVWEVLTNFSDYPNWNPFIKSIEGDVKQENQIKAVLSDMTFKPIVLKFEPNKEFRWKGKLLVKGLFDGEHYFQLIENKNGTTTFVHGEHFSGILVGMFKKKLMNETNAGFIAMNEALKEKVEQ